MQKAAMWLAILAAIAMAILNLAYDDSLPPDETYPMANQRITWNTAK